MESLKIKLFNPRELFFCHQPIRGYVQAKLTEALVDAALEVEFTGTYFFRTGSGGYEPLKFAGYVQELHMNVSGIERGTSECPFSVRVEPFFPSSLVCAAGSVQYKLVARCRYKLASDVATQHRIDETKYLSIIQLLDVQQLAVARLGSVAQQDIRSHVFKCCWRRVCHMYMSTKRRAYVSGEKIEASVMLLNTGSRVIYDVELRLIQVVETAIKRRYTTIVSCLRRGEIAVDTSVSWTDLLLPIPPLPPSTDDPQISISYSLVLEMKRGNKVYAVSIPIMIGSKPLESISIASVSLEPSFIVPGSVNMREEACAFIPNYPVYTPAIIPSPEEILAETGV